MVLSGENIPLFRSLSTKTSHYSQCLRIIQNSFERVRYEEKYLKMLDFSTCQTRSNDFWIMIAMCTFIYLFVVYFSSASIHRYVNYFDIKVLMMVTETKTLTSILHHNIFTYLDNVFLLPSYCRIKKTRIDTEKWEGIEEGWRVISSWSPHPF